MDSKETALNYFSNGFNCSQSVFTTFAVRLGMSEKTALMVSTSFGGGARCGQLCGAVSGALMALGLKFGHFEQGNLQQKSDAYAIACEFNEKFKAKNGTVVCKELLGYDLTNPNDLEIIKDNNLFKTICPKMVADAVEITEQIINERNKGEL